MRFESVDRARHNHTSNAAYNDRLRTIYQLIANGSLNTLKSLLFIDSDIALTSLSSMLLVQQHQLNSINKIVLSTSEVDTCDLQHLATLLNACTQLKCLYLYAEKDVANVDSLAQSITAHATLDDLQINPAMEMPPTALLHSVIHRSTLKKLQLSGFNVTPATTIELLQSCGSSIESINMPIFEFDRCDRATLEQLGALLGQALHLKELFLYGVSASSPSSESNNISGVLSIALSSPDHPICKSLNLFSVESVPLNAGVFDSLSHCQSLSVLKLSDGSLSNVETQQLLAVSRLVSRLNKSLYYLSLASNGLTGASEAILCPALTAHPSLKELDVSGNKFIGDHLMSSIAPSDRLLSLTLNNDHFSVAANDQLTNYTKNTQSLVSYQNLASRQIDLFSLLAGQP
ncbi:hypothetical protein SAMD00019534_126440 [Acytostelium subglobosum LB1]|uniref:hypothetical protein n=1 Tax=Acytostelium subglobosum LB1 TaxID=1410327 RepID=UPI0006450D66|nr:hypothetical protein SAMD00019534_126440 [Acytostelium subglobosum LB1]GAM29468.1 hypothetical protein SAMD00019534_126440 [Acytostelium subglobosum LB1]|eukprot:XP_012747587.1 hypothetical protein SAMD00019534_126440 [Acytostelium subglobosum LB1]